MRACGVLHIPIIDHFSFDCLNIDRFLFSFSLSFPLPLPPSAFFSSLFGRSFRFVVAAVLIVVGFTAAVLRAAPVIVF